MSKAYERLEKVLEKTMALPVSYTHLDVYKRQPLTMCCFTDRRDWGRQPYPGSLPMRWA